jgi:hypothetical protein
MQSTSDYRESESPPIKQRQLQRRHARGAAQKHVPRTKAPPRNVIGRAIAALIPDNTPRFYWHVIELFQERASYSQIKDWRRGKAKTPAWTLSVLELELQKRIQEMTEALEAIKNEKKSRT